EHCPARAPGPSLPYVRFPPSRRRSRRRRARAAAALQLAPAGAPPGDRAPDRLERDGVHDLPVDEALPEEPQEVAPALAVEAVGHDRPAQLEQEEEHEQRYDSGASLDRLRKRLPLAR